MCNICVLYSYKQLLMGTEEWWNADVTKGE